jgi:putative tricarboxylic transport membrane protein
MGEDVMGTDKVTGLFFFFLSIYVCIESYRDGLGSFSNPKAGLFPFMSGVLLGFLSFLGFFEKMPLKEAFKDTSKTVREWRLQKVIYTLVALLLYIFLLESLGFLICTFLLIFSVYLAIEPKKIKTGILVGILSTIPSYLVFQVLLKVELPRGFLGI